MSAARVLLVAACCVLPLYAQDVTGSTEPATTPGPASPPPAPLRPEYAHPAGAEELDPYRAEAERRDQRDRGDRPRDQREPHDRDDPAAPEGERLLRGAADDPPMFLLEPQDAFVLRQKPATLRCRAANALQAYFMCGGERVESGHFEFVDPQSGVRIVEAETNVTRDRLDEYFGGEPFACACHAWSSRGNIRSAPAAVQLAYIKKSFSPWPSSTSVALGSRAVLRCGPPPGAPAPRVTWTRHGQPLRSDQHLAADRGDLVIARATLQDMANYSCVAENIAGKRVTEPALLTVYVNGGWSAWSPWAACRCAGRAGAGQRRARACSEPPPLNGGAPCAGPAVQRTHDCAPCPHNASGGGGGGGAGGARWGSWSAWGPCGADCRQRRRRSCAADCAGPAEQHAACTGDLCPHYEGVSGGAVALYCGAAAALALVAAGAALLLRALRAGRARRALYSITRTADYPSGAFSAAEKAALAGPDLTRGPDQHHYDVPDLTTSYSSPMDQHGGGRGSRDRSGRGDDYDARPYADSDHSASSCFTSSGSGGSAGAVTLRLAELVADSEVARSAAAGGGARAALPAGGVALGVPAGAVPAHERVYVALVRDDRYRPRLGPGVTVLSPVVRCGPPRSGLARPAVLELPHCARLEPGAWAVTLLAAEATPGPVAWTRAADYGTETVGTPALLALEPARALVLTDALSAFVLVGEAARGAGKALRLAVGASPAEARGTRERVELRAYLLEDTPCAALVADEAERRAGGVVRGSASLLLRRGGGDVTLRLERLAGGWRATGGARRDVPADELWGSPRVAPRWTFSLERSRRGGEPPALDVLAAQAGGDACAVSVSARAEPRVQANPLADGARYRLGACARARLAARLEADGGWRRLAGALGVRYPTWLAARAAPADLLLELWEARGAGGAEGVEGLRASLLAAGLDEAARVLDAALEDDAPCEDA